MEYFVVEGGHRLSGEIVPQGAKNEALQILCAVLLTEEAVRIDNLPDILDIRRLIELLEEIGVDVEHHSRQSATFRAKNLKLDYLDTEAYRKKAAALRGSVMLVGPLLARRGKASIPRPGGDKIGRRRLDTHIVGLQTLGATFRYDSGDDRYYLDAPATGLKGAYMLLDEASVTGTANIVMAAVLAKGTTTIYNAACEPYLQQLCSMLVRMGAKIDGIGSNLLVIEGVQRLGGTTHTLLADMIEVGSFIGMAAMTQSALTIRNAAVHQLGLIPEVFRRMGIQLTLEGDNIHVQQQELYQVESFIDGSILTVQDHTWPGLTPDLLSVFLVLATQAKGNVLIHQKMFESRLFFVDKLIDMGAKIILCDPHRATVIGLARQHKLKGIKMSSPDIRAGVALLIAAMSAEGKSRIDNIEQIDRGYQYIDQRLQALGAKVQRLEE